jgi:hypothetical protein
MHDRILSPSGPTVAKPSVDHIPAGGFVFLMRLRSHVITDTNSFADEDIFERRSRSRTVINRGALMFYAGKTGVETCTVRDVTNLGAGIRLHERQVVPVNFDLSFDNFRTNRKSRLIWREGDFVGVVFES